MECKMNKGKDIVFIFVCLIGLLIVVFDMITIGYTIGYKQGYDKGFDSCIEENNLYERYRNNETISD